MVPPDGSRAEARRSQADRAEHARDPDRDAARAHPRSQRQRARPRPARRGRSRSTATLEARDARHGARPARRSCSASTVEELDAHYDSDRAVAAASPRSSRSTSHARQRARRSSSTQRTIRASTSMLLTVREYPVGRSRAEPLAAQVLGYVGEIDGEQLKALKRGLRTRRPDRSRRRRGGVRERCCAARRRSRPCSRPAGEQVGDRRRVDARRHGRQRRVPHDRRGRAAGRGEALAQGILGAREHQNEDIEDGGYETSRRRRGAVIVLDVRGRLGRARWRATPRIDPAAWVGGISNRTFDDAEQPGEPLPAGQPRDARSVRARLDVQARDLARDDPLRRSARIDEYYTDDRQVFDRRTSGSTTPSTSATGR